MKIENLKEGMEIKNYKELCLVLEEGERGGNSKKAQLKELERFIRYRKSGNKFIVEEIYVEPLERVDNRTGQNSKYKEDIEKIILYMCKELDESKDYKSIELSASAMMLKINMVNENFNTGKFNMSKLSRFLKIPIETVRDFYNNTSPNFEDSIIRVLMDLENRCLIDWNFVIKIQLTNGKYRVATDSEIICIKECEQETLQEMKMENKSQVVRCGKWNEFYSNVISMLENTAIRKYYKSIRILTTEQFRIMIKEIGIDYNKDSKNSLNEKIVENTIANAQRRQDKALEKFTRKTLKGLVLIDDVGKKQDRARLLSDFVKDIEILTDICIKDIGYLYINLLEEIKKIDKDNPYTLEDKNIEEYWDKLYITKQDFVGLFG